MSQLFGLTQCPITDPILLSITTANPFIFIRLKNSPIRCLVQALRLGLMANYSGSDTSGNMGDSSMTNFQDPVNRGQPRGPLQKGPSKTVTGRKLFMAKNPGAPGKLGKSSTKAESLSKLRGKGALA